MRNSTALDAIAEAHVDAIAAHDPLSATDCGIPGYDHLLPDFSPEEAGRWVEHLRDIVRLEEFEHSGITRAFRDKWRE